MAYNYGEYRQETISYSNFLCNHTRNVLQFGTIYLTAEFHIPEEIYSGERRDLVENNRNWMLLWAAYSGSASPACIEFGGRIDSNAYSTIVIPIIFNDGGPYYRRVLRHRDIAYEVSRLFFHYLFNDLKDLFCITVRQIPCKAISRPFRTYYTQRISLRDPPSYILCKEPFRFNVEEYTESIGRLIDEVRGR